MIAGLVSSLLVGAPLRRNWSACDLSRATWVRELARQKLEAADPGSVLITQGDSDINPIWYVHDVLKVRPDIVAAVQFAKQDDARGGGSPPPGIGQQPGYQAHQVIR